MAAFHWLLSLGSVPGLSPIPLSLQAGRLSIAETPIWNDANSETWHVRFLRSQLSRPAVTIGSIFRTLSGFVCSFLYQGSPMGPPADHHAIHASC
jgi:hypothetical protein